MPAIAEGLLDALNSDAYQRLHKTTSNGGQQLRGHRQARKSSALVQFL